MARDDVLDAIDGIEVGSGVGTIIPVSQVPIPTERTRVLKHTGGGLQGELPLVRRVGEGQPFAVDWRNDLSANARPVSVDVVEITSGPDGGVTISDEESDTGADRSQAEFKLTLNSVGTYTLALEVTYLDSEGSGTATAEVIHDGDRAVLVSCRTRAKL